MPKTDYKTLYNREVEKNNKLSDELNYYKDLGILNVIDNSGSPQETFEKIEEVI